MLIFHVASLCFMVLLGILSLKELYQSKKALASLEEEFVKLLSIKKEIKSLEDRLFGFENTTIRSLDSQVTDIRIELDLLKKKIFSQKVINPQDGY
jgi:biopolymer transport protein ExbB/TolQ